jgi:hypothetical protein
LKVDLLAVEDLKKLDELAKYLKEKNPIILTKLNEDNLPGLVYILTKSNQLVIEKVLHDLIYIHELNDDDLSRVINQMTVVFGIDNYENVLANSVLVSELDGEMSKIINSSLLFLVTDNSQIKNNLKLVTKFGANIKSILEKCTIALIEDLMPRNLKILDIYGFNLEDFFKEKDACYVLLNSRDLATKLDGLIEVNLNEYMHSSPSFAGNSFRTLVIKRVYYAYKNGLAVWGDNPNNINHKFEAIINESNLIIDDSVISLLIAEHPIIEVIDAGYRPAIYSTTPLALLKRKTELLFKQNIISRLKAYRVFKILIDNGVSEKEAMFYGLTYKANLDKDEYTAIVTAVEGSGEGA